MVSSRKNLVKTREMSERSGSEGGQKINRWVKKSIIGFIDG